MVEAEQLRRTYGALHDQVDALWFERQWLTAEIAVAGRELVDRPPACGEETVKACLRRVLVWARLDPGDEARQNRGRSR